MKTLDEVIKALEKQLGVGGEDAIENCLEADALHYLKEYKQDHMTLAEAAKRLTEKEHALATADRNEALTWEELRQMEGKPVFIKFAELATEWFLIYGIDDDVMNCRACNGDTEHLSKDGNGTFWQAYRKERE